MTTKVNEKLTVKPLYFSLMGQFVIYAFSLVGIGYPVLEFLFWGRGSFGDLVDGLILTPAYYSPILGETLTFSQPNSPLTILFYRILRSFLPSMNFTNWDQVNWTSIFLLILTVFFISLLSLYKLCGSISTTIILGLSFPMFFSLGRANPDMFCFILLCLYLFAMKKEKYIIASILIAVMGALKLPFLILSLIFLIAKKIQIWIASLVLCFVLFYGPLLFFPYDFFGQVSSINGVASNYQRDYVLGEGGSLFNNSLFGLLKLISYILKLNTQEDALSQLQANERIVYIHLFIVLIIVAAVFLAACLNLETLRNKFNSNRNDTVSQASLVLVSLAILLPFVSAEYRLVMLIPPFAIFFQSRTVALKLRRSMVILLSLLLLPKSLVKIEFDDAFLGLHVLDSMINPIIILIICFLSVRELLQKEIKGTK